MIRLFRHIALLEGVTALALFLIAMPAKHVFNYAALVPPIGMIHGMAWIIYIAAMIPALLIGRAGIAGWLRTFAASTVPFGTFLNDLYLRNLERA